MPMFSGLDGVKGGTLEGPIVRSATAAMQALKDSRVVSGAGDHGAWTVWKDDAGLYRCDFSRYMVTKNAATLSTKKAVREWLAEWVPACHSS